MKDTREAGREKPLEDGQQGVSQQQFCSFRLAGRLYGVDILDVKEINPETVFTPIFHAPEEVRGYVNIRGQINLVLDLRRLLGFDPRPIDQDSRIVLFKPHVGENYGVLVDQVGDVVSVSQDRIEDRRADSQGVPEGRERRNELRAARGVCKLEKELLVILDARAFLTTIKTN